MNRLKNLVQATQDKESTQRDEPRILLKTERSKYRAQIEIVDNGPEMDEYIAAMQRSGYI